MGARPSRFQPHASGGAASPERSTLSLPTCALTHVVLCALCASPSRQQMTTKMAATSPCQGA